MAEHEEMQTKWTGRDLYDLNGDKIGTVSDVRYGDIDGAFTWLVVKTGLFGSKRILAGVLDLPYRPRRL